MTTNAATYSEMVAEKHAHREEMTEYIEFYEKEEVKNKLVFQTYRECVSKGWIPRSSGVARFHLLNLAEDIESQKLGTALRDHDIVKAKKYETAVLQNLQNQLDHVMFDLTTSDAEQLYKYSQTFKVDETVIRIGKRMLMLNELLRDEIVWLYEFKEHFKDVKCKGGCGGCEGCGR